MELMWVHVGQVVDVLCGTLEIFVQVKTCEEEQLVCLERLNDLAEELGLSKLNTLGVNQNDFFLIEAGREQCLQANHAHLLVEREGVIHRLGTVGLTTLPEMRSSLITLASASRLFLRSHLSIGPSNISSSEGTLISLPVQVVEILVH